ncbi:regulatory protein, luxR family [Lutibacter oricola]|uniref:Regulatory protein, luxR family n=1 Tax=Lutibacter oricola TaxID=762486 RepID=A0A1H3FT82_9FLAO|nr:triple tyrosine motif-containing protein [Lutibacter oricola]SDX94140.1 regulatory protein, luxR family [Lutibacter oricola]
MNFIKSTYIFFIFFSVTVIKAQELPPIVNYTPQDYSGRNQNWKIDQSSEGYLYIGNNSGLLEYNGANWSLYPTKNNSSIRAVKIIKNKIFTGCYMDFGYWLKNDFGNLCYISLINKLDKPLLEDETFWNILNFEEYVLFQSLSRIYIYSVKDETFKVIEAPSKRAVLFKVGDYVYFQKSNEGIFRIENGKAVLVSDNEVVKNQEIIGAFFVDKKPLFITNNGKFYFFEDNKVVKWNVNSEEELKNRNIYSSLQLSDGSFVLGTVSNGLYHIDSKGGLLKNINKENGLLNNTVLCVYEDIDKNVWLGLDNGVCTINLNSPFNVYNDVKGNLGSVYASVIYKNKLYLGTNQGLFYTTLNSNKEPVFIKNTQGQVWFLKVVDNTLFCGHNTGTFTIKDNKATKISDFPGAWDVKKIEGQENLLLQGNYNGICVLEKVNTKWKFRNKIEGFDISSRFFEFIAPTELLINHEYKGVFRIKFNNELTKVISKIKSKPFGEESSLVVFNNTILHASNNGVFKFSKKKNDFVKDTILSSLLYSENNPIKGNLISDNTNKLWGFSNNNIVFVKQDAFNNKPKRINIPVEKSYNSSMVIAGFENLRHIQNEEYLVGNSSGFTVLNTDRIKTNSYNVAINSVYKQELNYNKQQLALNKTNSLKATENNVYIAFSVPVYDKNTEVNYQYRLKGFYDEWGSWSNESSTSFKNLPFGTYNFEVKAKIGNKISENIATYSFRIERPWYLSNIAIVLYSITFILLFLLVHNLYKRYFNKQKLALVKKKQREFAVSQLESDKVIMKLKNEKLKNEVDSKTRELSVSTMSIIKKNELLNTIKKELLVLKSNKEITPVIKIINKNLSPNSDWEMFEEAFNNADTDFLKKIKEIHPNLTPNDLRLCAYLRLNLSSKEIAPLLNISPRSVEIKRYRLRKKIELPHEKSLVEYILEI